MVIMGIERFFEIGRAFNDLVHFSFSLTLFKKSRLFIFNISVTFHFFARTFLIFSNRRDHFLPPIKEKEKIKVLRSKSTP